MDLSKYAETNGGRAERFRNKGKIKTAAAAKVIAVASLALLFCIGNAEAEEETVPKLLLLAREQFNGSKETKFDTGTGEDFFRAVAKGGKKEFIHQLGKGVDSNDSAMWPSVKAAWIVWLCTDAESSKLVTAHGIDISGARIDGKIDLESARVPFRLLIRNCNFTEDLSVRGAHLQELNLNGSHVKGLQAHAAQIEGDVLLREGFESSGEVTFDGAQIGGNFDCTGAHLHNPDGYTLNAIGAKIAGSVLLNADSEIKLEVPGVKNDTVKYFSSEGELLLIWATIGGSLECTGAHFINPDGYALSAQRLKVACDLFLNDGFMAQGKIELSGANIAGYVMWKGVASPNKAIFHFESANVGTLSDEAASWPAINGLYLDGFVYSRIDSASPTDAKSRLDWLKRMPNEQFFPQPYEQLATVLKNMGHDEQVAEVLVAKNQEHGRCVHKTLGQEALATNDALKKMGSKDKPFAQACYARVTSKDWWWYNVIGHLIGYGHRPERAFYISVAIIALGYVLFKIGYARGWMWPTDEKVVEMKLTGEPVTSEGCVVVPKDYPRFNAFIYSLEAFTPFVQLGQNSRWNPNANRGKEHRVLWSSVTNGGFLRGYFWFHVIAGWGLTTLWVGAITGLVKS